MPFKKGESGNKEGRPKGKLNKITAEIRDKIAPWYQGEIDNKHYEKAMEQVRKERPDSWVKLFHEGLAYVIPKKRDITSDDKPIQPAINISEDRTKPEAD